MRETSKYLSDWFIDTFWLEYKNTLKLESTRKAYFSNVCYACDYLQKDFLAITPDDAKAYFSYLQGKKPKLTTKTLHSKLSCLRSINEHIVVNQQRYGLEYQYQNVFYSVSLPNFDTSFTKEDIATPKELDLLLNAAKEYSPQMFLILILIIRCGLTVAEICNLRTSHVILDGADRCFITITNQNKQRNVFVPNDVLPYLSAAAYQAPPSGHLFKNECNRPLIPRTLQLNFSVMLSQANLDTEFTLRSLRTTSMAYMLSGHASKAAVAEYTGTDGRWLYRFDKVKNELQNDACEMSTIRII